MDKKEFIKALFIVGLLYTFLTAVIAGWIYLLVIVVKAVPILLLVVLLFVIIGYSSAFIYLKLKGKE